MRSTSRPAADGEDRVERCRAPAACRRSARWRRRRRGRTAARRAAAGAAPGWRTRRRGARRRAPRRRPAGPGRWPAAGRTARSSRPRPPRRSRRGGRCRGVPARRMRRGPSGWKPAWRGSGCAPREPSREGLPRGDADSAGPVGGRPSPSCRPPGPRPARTGVVAVPTSTRDFSDQQLAGLELRAVGDDG